MKIEERHQKKRRKGDRCHVIGRTMDEMESAVHPPPVHGKFLEETERACSPHLLRVVSCDCYVIQK